jgi:hypothetical protein
MFKNLSGNSYVTYFIDGNRITDELQLDLSPDGWWFSLSDFITASTKWSAKNIDSAVLGIVTINPFFTKAESYSFRDPLGVTGASLIITFDKDTIAFTYDAPKQELSFSYIVDIASNTISHNRYAIGISEYYEFYGSTDLYPQGLDPLGLLYSNPVNAFSLDNIWTGSVFDDKLFGYEGNDTIYGGNGNDYIVGDEGNDNLFGDSGDDNLFGESGNDIIYGGDGNDTIWGREGSDIIYGGLGIDTSAHSNNSNDISTKFKVKLVKNTGGFADSTFAVENQTTKELDLITGIEYILFTDKKINVNTEKYQVFNQVDSINAPSAQIFRLYNAAFARFPDADGLRYWISDYNKQNIKNIASNFIISNEFISKYGQTNTTSNFVDNLYLNILGRLPDESGKNYWVNQINSSKETRSLVLLGFSESIENKGIFSDLTGLK